MGLEGEDTMIERWNGENNTLNGFRVFISIVASIYGLKGAEIFKKK